jgi:hypothetical protein
MISSQEKNAIDRLPSMTSEHGIKNVMRNAKDDGPEVYRAAFERLVEVSTSQHNDPVARSCWKMERD